MRYLFKCPGACNYALMINAQNDDEAVDRIIETGEVHRKETHPDIPSMTREQLRNIVRSGMKKVMRGST